uniref:RNase H type-1 domain-containing protein n=1 Tax=Cajanus cajan TaxID=3821 RepID=A0A151U1F2_CAJCA|nr:hypothetical protein KK1_005733 [Cajanus cajan]
MIQKGLMIVWQRNFRNVICVFDSLHTINLVLGSREPFHRYAVLVAEIKDLLDHEWRTSLVHSLRKGNQCTDFLSKWGPNCENELVIIDDIPVGLQPLLQADSSSILFRRVEFLYVLFFRFLPFLLCITKVYDICTSFFL